MSFCLIVCQILFVDDFSPCLITSSCYAKESEGSCDILGLLLFIDVYSLFTLKLGRI